MDNCFTVRQIGVIRVDGEDFRVEVAPEYREALSGLEGFSYLNVLWWFSACDNAAGRGRLTEVRPYAKGPGALGVFATRSPERPNPIALSCAYVTRLDVESGVIGLSYLDAFDGSPVLDIKPYTPSLDRVEAPVTPDWCAHWPKDVERSGDFDWAREFLF